MVDQIKCIFSVLLFVTFSCSENSPTNAGRSSNQEEHYLITSTGDSLLTGVPFSIQGKEIHTDSLGSHPQAPPLKKEQIAAPFQMNKVPAGTGLTLEWPKNPTVITPGENGIPLPEVVPAFGIIQPVLYPEPVAALPMQMKDQAKADIRYLNVHQNLNTSSIWTMLKDHRGNLWFGTMGGGVSRYDGATFTHFTERTGLTSNHIFSILEDRQGNLWFGTRDGGVSRYDGTHFTHFTTEGGLAHNFVLCMLEDSQGNIWFGTRGGVSRYDGTHFTNFTSKEGLAFDEVISLFEDSRQNIWIGTGEGSGLHRFDGKSLTHFNVGQGKGKNDVHSILEDRQGHLWFGTWGGGVSRFDGTHLTSFTIEEGLLSNNVLSILEDEQGQIWFGCMAGGVSRYDGTNFTHYTSAEGLSSGFVRFILEDGQGNIWACTWDSGVNRINENGFTHHLEHTFDESFFSAILKDRRGNLWLAGENAGIIEYDGAQFTHYFSDESITLNGVGGVHEDKKGNVWLGTGAGLSRFTGENLFDYTQQEGFYPWDVRAILEDDEGILWLGTQGHGLMRFDGKTLTQISEEEGFSSNDVYSIFEDSQGNIWFGTLGGGTCRYDGTHFIHYTTNEGLSHNYVLSIMEDRQGYIWFGTEAGLSRFDGSRFTQYTAKDGLLDDYVYSLLGDAAGNIWITSEKGISLLKSAPDSSNGLTRDAYEFFRFGPADGLKNTQVSQGMMAIDHQNKIWFPFRDGVKILDLNRFVIPDQPPQQVQITNLNINQEFIDFRRLPDTSYASTLSIGKNLQGAFDSVAAFNNYPVKMTLPYTLNHLTFHFSAIDWSAPQKIQYSYKMDGVDADWSYPQSEPRIDYRNMSYGEYTLHVKAMGGAQVWSAPFSYTFTIAPPWWLTWWAKSFYGLAFLGMIYLIRESELRKQRRKLEAQQRINHATSRFVPTAFLQSLGRKDILEVQLGDAVEQEVTVLFSDIRDYAALSENMSPQETFLFVNTFNKIMGPVIQRNRGFVNQYLGDAIMALFKNSPLDALQAAIQMQQALVQYNNRHMADGSQPIRMGIGFHTGSLIMGIIGDDQRMDAATISDTVNSASRIESLSKHFKVNILLSDESLKQIRQGQSVAQGRESVQKFNFRFLGKVQLKGKKDSIGVYECFDGDDPVMIAKKQETQVLFKEGMECYLSQDFKQAAAAFEQIVNINGNDFTAQLFFQKSSQLLLDGVPENWTGVEVMTFK